MDRSPEADIGDVRDSDAAAAAQEVEIGTFGAMGERFDGAAGAFAYLLFILLYFPCAAAMGAVRREAGGRWTVFVGLWTTGMAYVAATLFFQIATLGRDPGAASAWIAGVILLSVLVIVAMRRRGARGGVPPRAVARQTPAE